MHDGSGMDTGTVATALCVLQTCSVREAARRLAKPVSSVADAFDRFEQWLALPLATRGYNRLTLTLAGEVMLQSLPRFIEPLRGIMFSSPKEVVGEGKDCLSHVAGTSIPLGMLANFLAVVEGSSIRRAARERGLSQPALTRQMTRLEDMLGRTLLQRSGRGCAPTEAGLSLVTQAALLLARLSAVSGSAEQRFADRLRTVRLGTIIPFGHDSRLAARLAYLVADWRAKQDGQSLLLSSMTAEDLLAGLSSGALDLALTDIAVSDRRFESRLLFSSELVLVGPPSVPPHESFSLAMHGKGLVVPSLRSGLRQKIDTVLDTVRDPSAAPPVLVEVDTLSIVMNLVLSHGYVTILPVDAVKAIAGQIRLMRLPQAPSLSFYLVWLRNQTASRHADKIGTILSRYQAS